MIRPLYGSRLNIVKTTRLDQKLIDGLSFLAVGFFFVPYWHHRAHPSWNLSMAKKPLLHASTVKSKQFPLVHLCQAFVLGLASSERKLTFRLKGSSVLIAPSFPVCDQSAIVRRSSR